MRGLCVCLLVTTVRCAKTDEPIEIPFEVWTCGAHRIVEPKSLREGAILGKHLSPHCKVQEMTVAT